MAEENNFGIEQNYDVSKFCSFAGRLEFVIGGEKNTSTFAKKCGINESLLRKYLAGSTPGIDKVVKIADASGFSVAWLVANKMPMRQDQLDEMLSAREDAYRAMAGDPKASSRQDSRLDDYGRRLRVSREMVNQAVAGRALAESYKALLQHFAFVYDQPEGDDFLDQITDALCELTARVSDLEGGSNGD